jgi:hypothetical protein
MIIFTLYDGATYKKTQAAKQKKGAAHEYFNDHHISRGDAPGVRPRPYSG